MKKFVACFLIAAASACSRSPNTQTSTSTTAPSGVQVSAVVASTSFNNNASLQLAFTAATTTQRTSAPAHITVERVTLLDGSSRAELQTLSIGAPNIWNVSPALAAPGALRYETAEDNAPQASADAKRAAPMAYKPWDGMIAPGTTVKASYPLSSGDMPPVSSKEYRYRAVIDVDGKKITIETQPFTRTGDVVT
jgi:hypothetical protein